MDTSALLLSLSTMSLLSLLSGCSDEGIALGSSIEKIGDDAPFPSRFGTPIEGGGQDTDFVVFELSRGGESYNVQTNPWGGAAQVIKAGGGNVFEVISMVEPGGGNSWDVAAYPSVYRGVDQGGNVSAGSNLPIALTDITSIRTGFSTNTTSIDFKGNTTYDVYFTKDARLTGGPPDNFLMVWFDASNFNPIISDESYGCGGKAPTYVEACANEGAINISGRVFYRFFGSNGHADVVSYVPIERMDSWEFDLKYFIDDAMGQGLLGETVYLQSVQAGFEMVTGGAGLIVKDFYVDIE